jgi:alkylhydroperoxidase/carboxymuconolactone decarboxylase family protein YurZ
MSTHVHRRIQLADPQRLVEIESEAPESVKQHLQLVREGVKKIPGVTPDVAEQGYKTHPTLLALALKPQIFYSWWLMEYHSGKEGEVDSATKELLGVAVSSRTEEAGHGVCTPYHGGAARFEGATDDAVAIAEDFETRKHEFPDKLRTTIEFGLKVAYDPRGVTDEDIEGVRGFGYSDAALIEIVSTALIVYDLVALNQVFDLKI